MTNAELFKLATQITDLTTAQTLVREVALTITDPVRHDSLMKSADRIFNDILALNLKVRRLCGKPYGNAS